MYTFGYGPMHGPPGPPRMPRMNRLVRKRSGCRRIFFSKGEHDFRWLANLQRFGCRSYQYLNHIGAFVGDFMGNEWADQFARRHEHFIYSEPDVKVKIGEPQAGEVAPSLEEVPWGVERIEAHRAWPVTMGKGVKVAVIDTGAAFDHPALARNYRGGVNIRSPLFTPYDYNGHGTHVAGTIAARNNPTGVIGVAPRAHLYAVKAFDRKGSANLSDLLAAINWCINNRMDVVNMSFGMNTMSESLKLAIQKAREGGIVMVAAAGNKGTKGKVDYPARFPETIAVAATSKNDELASFSNSGRNVRLAAPGDKITSSWINGKTRELSGTSMAVPHVTGTVALLKSLYPELAPAEIEAIMDGSSRPLRTLSSGRIGVINAYRAVKMLNG